MTMIVMLIVMKKRNGFYEILKTPSVNSIYL